MLLSNRVYYYIRRRRRPVFERRKYLQNRERARALVHAKVEKINKIYQFSFGRISIKNHRSRWGSCSKKGNLNFNYKIIFLPERLAEYIVAHELCHLGEFNHSKNFWNLVSRAFPDYRSIRAQIKKQIISD
ncbi:MAG: M48 family metallopeptidase [Candidatus Magasanikbacteria bacterium]